ncbi:MAG: hypothetical protein NVSMB52_08690 [Chloroflexota bacterium]
MALQAVGTGHQKRNYQDVIQVRSAVVTSTSTSSAVVTLPSEERRLVTALFSDLIGFTPLPELGQWGDVES